MDQLNENTSGEISDMKRMMNILLVVVGDSFKKRCGSWVKYMAECVT